MPGSLPDLSVVISYEIVVHPSTFKASTIVGSEFLHSQHRSILWHLNSSPVLQYLVALSRAAFVNTQESS
jgi:hypothetical protein